MVDQSPASQVRAGRMRSLLLTPHPITTPLGVVEWFGAMQSQDASSGLWSIGVRLPGSVETDLRGAFERAEIVRTWPMRSTIHTIPAVDAHWMLALTGVRGLDRLRTRRQELGLLPRNIDRALEVMATVLSGGRLLPRADLLAALEEAGIPTDRQRGYHLLLYASQSALTCMGPQRDGSPTFVLLDDWAPRPQSLSRDDALVELAYRYVRSHGPASVKDLAGWTGLTLTDARAGLTGNEGRLTRASDELESRWLTTELAEAMASGPLADHEVVALPGYDEYMLGFKDRSLHGDHTLLDRVVPGGNGVFRSTIVADGCVVATWTRTLKPGRVRIDVTPFARVSRPLRAAMTRALDDYARFVDREPEIRFDRGP